jgi:hypothetical protein
MLGENMMKQKSFLQKYILLATILFPIFALLISNHLASGKSVMAANPNNGSVPTTITYQGFLDDAGNPASGTYDLQFALFDAATSGTQIGTTWVVEDVAINNGVFTANLDFGNIFDGTSLWLEIGVRPGSSTGSFTILSPRQSLTPTPYALFALTAPWSGLLNVPSGFADGTDDDTTYAAGTGLALSGGSFSLALTYRLPQGCSNGSIPKWNGSSWLCGTDDIGASAWNLTGNSGTSPGTHFLGTTDNQALQLRVKGARDLLLQPDPTSPN